MSRIARIVLENLPYHITQRGNGRQLVFFDAPDYRLYLDLLRTYAGDAGLRVWAFCLMPNHVHLIGVPERADAMASALGRTHADFARHFNLKNRSCGHMWQARFFSCPLGPTHLWRAMAYVERNPVRAGMVEHAAQYEWSSARAHLGLAKADGFLELAACHTEYTQSQWNEVLDAGTEEEAFRRRLQEASRRGRPLGSDEFVRKLESRAGRELRPLPAGRPRKARAKGDGQLVLDIGI